MPPQQQSARIDIVELKAQIVKKIGAEMSKKYFYYLDRFLNQKLSKSDFDKFCSRALGRENLPLHNLLILSILKNVCHAKTPPPSTNESCPTQLANHDGHEQNGSHVGTWTMNEKIRSNGIVLPMSSRKGRSRKLRDRPCPLGINGTVNNVSHRSTTIIEDGVSKVVMQNGDFTPCDYQRPNRQLHGHAEQSDNHRDVSLRRSLEGQVALYCKDDIDVSVIEDGKEVEQSDDLNFHRTPLIAPLGIPFCSASIGGSRRALSVSSSSNYVRYYDSGGFYEIETLKARMEEIALAQGLEGVTLESATMLNSMLDLYLKKLIKSCVDLVVARSGNELKKQLFHKQQVQNGIVNDMRPSNHMHMQSSSGSLSLLDFKVAMELNPQQLGEDWPLLLEKICMRAFEK